MESASQVSLAPPPTIFTLALLRLLAFSVLGGVVLVLGLLVLDQLHEGVYACGLCNLQHHVGLLQDEQTVTGVTHGKVVSSGDMLLRAQNTTSTNTHTYMHTYIHALRNP